MLKLLRGQRNIPAGDGTEPSKTRIQIENHWEKKMTTRSSKKMFRPALFLASMACLATPALADTVCTASFANTTIVGNLIVPSGASCTLTGVLVTGGVQLQQGAVSFTANSSYIFGDLQSQGAAITLTNSSSGIFYAPAITTISGHLQVTGGSLFAEGVFVRGDLQANALDSVVIGGVSIGGNLTIQNTIGVPPVFGTNFVCGATVGNNVQLQANGHAATFTVGASGAVGCPSNTILGNAEMNNNQAVVTIIGNIVTGNLQCQDSPSALPTGSGNTVGGTKNGQCTGM
jgi:hypothetical protein